MWRVTEHDTSTMYAAIHITVKLHEASDQIAELHGQLRRAALSQEQFIVLSTADTCMTHLDYDSRQKTNPKSLAPIVHLHQCEHAFLMNCRAVIPLRICKISLRPKVAEYVTS